MDTKQLKQRILDLAIRGKLVQQDPNDEPASVLLERIRAEKEQLIAQGKLKKSKTKSSDKPHYENVPFEIPESWEWVTLGELLINRDSERIPLSSAVRKKQTNKIYPYYGAAGVIDKVEKYIFSERLLLIGEDGANLLTRSKDNAFFAEGKYWVNNHAHVLDCSNKIVLDFVAFVINASTLDQYITGSAQPKLSQDNLNRIAIPLPPISEQKRIIEAKNSWFTLIDELEANKEDLKEYIKQVKSNVLDLAIHGKLVPQDPNDEPAIELLKRINPNFKPCDTSHYENLPAGWSICLLEDIIDYEQPTQYIVASTDYNDEYKTPVLTAGKSFILGYTNESNGIYNNLPTIIFDDFTTDSRLVNFPFKVKSSAMKILQVDKDISIQYVAYFMSITRLAGNTHKRYWISEYSKIPIPIPPKEEQDRIVQIISEIENKLDSISAEL